ncbi:MAG: hypothetical protein Q9M28_03575 [Mariprofundaceae bacterium]|nr:hypothetical protein [Mariprofundaceae bacterium]
MTFKLPELFPLHEDKDFLTGREWVCLRLLCLDMRNLADTLPQTLCESTNQQVELARAQEIINIAQIARLEGLGTWISRLMVESGLVFSNIKTMPSSDIANSVNQHLGYPICNQKTIQSLEALQQQW